MTQNERARALNDAIAARSEARKKLALATERLTAAQETQQTGHAEVARLQAEEDAWVERHARRLETWVEDGRRGNAPTLLSDVKHAQAKTTAIANAKAADQLLETLRAAHSTAGAEVARAEGAVIQAAKATLIEEAQRMVAELDELKAEEIRLLEELGALDTAMPLTKFPHNTQSPIYRAIHHAQQAHLALDPGINRIRMQGRVPHWTERLAALIERGVPEAASVEAQAAA